MIAKLLNEILKVIDWYAHYLFLFKSTLTARFVCKFQVNIIVYFCLQ